MKCKRCGCTDSAPCITAVERPDRSHESVPCSWIIPALCSNCLTQDEQHIIAAFLDEQPGRSPLDVQREEFTKLMVARLLPAVAMRPDDHLSERQDDDMIETCRRIAVKAALVLIPDPEPDLGESDRIEIVDADAVRQTVRGIVESLGDSVRRSER